MDADTTRGLVNQVLYGIDFLPGLAGDAVEDRAGQILAQRVYRHPAAEYAEAIANTVRAGRLSDQTVDMSRRYSEPELLDFLARLGERLDAERP